MEEQLMTRRETAERLGVCVRTIDLMIRSGMIRAIRPTGGRAVRIVKSDLDEFIVGCKQKNVKPANK